MSVRFNNIPANLRVPLFYAEINAGQSPYQSASRTLLVGQKTSDGSAVANTPIILSGDPTAQTGVGSMLTEMAIWARQNNPFGEIWMLPVADPAGNAQTWTVTVGAGIAGQSGTLALYVGGELVQVGVAATDTTTNIAANIAAVVNAGYVKFGRKLAFPVIASAATNVVTLTARHTGTLFGKFDVRTNLLGNEGSINSYLTVASGTPGTGVPTLGAALASLGDQEFDYILSPYADATSLGTVRPFLDGISGRWSPIQQIYGHHLTVMFDTFANLAAYGSGLNDPNCSILGVAESPSPPWRWASAYGSAIASDKNLGGELDQAYRISMPVQTLPLVGILPPFSRANWFSITQRNTLYQDGIAGFTVERDGTVALDRVVTTYQTNSYNQPDITWLDIETRLQMVYFVRYMRQRITQNYGRCALADDNPSGNPGIVTARILKAAVIAVYSELTKAGLVDNADTFATAVIVERSSDPNRVNAYVPVDVVNQFRVFAMNATTFLEFPA
ncbi:MULTISPECIES: phage tail sheath C-terminal domain-containing protein [unclassified Bradyrhizobium]|uniref:phage tail sheath C-terminal domain-containing protein n=1 Tax=unclassified Bradyrhizobium TaxID=2631580 RepID=UPI002916CD3E|nr:MULTISPECIES: phage tail sheath C-terminal domain-containing protein [unclassified Bradyrhizobium]